MEKLHGRVDGECCWLSSEPRRIANARLGSTGTSKIRKVRPSWRVCKGSAGGPAYYNQRVSLFLQILRRLRHERQKDPDEKRRIGCRGNAVSNERPRHKRIPHRG